MRRLFSAILLTLAAATCRADELSAIRDDLKNLKLDKTATWHVRELEIAKGSTKVFLSEGVLSFATPVAGHRVAALFTTEGADGGDGEIIAFPADSAERASLARFTKSPNLDEHFSFALLFFADDTAQDLMRQIRERPLRAAELDEGTATKLGDVLNGSAIEIEVKLVESLLDRHTPADSFFYGMMSGKSLGLFDFLFQPEQVDTEVFGRLARNPRQADYFEVWCAYRERGGPAYSPDTRAIADYRIDTKIGSGLAMTSVAEFDYTARAEDGRAIKLMLTPRMSVVSAAIDGQEAGVVAHESARSADIRGATTFLLVNPKELAVGSKHHVTIHYAGSVIRRTSGGDYFVDDRNAWYPFISPMLANFELRYRIPADLKLVSTGELVSEKEDNGERILDYKTTRLEALAGFNLGRFDIQTTLAPPYLVEICASNQEKPAPDLASQTDRVLRRYSAWWMPLAIHTVAVTPIEGYFGQGFPGLIYLSNVSFMEEGNRPAKLRGAAMDSFFSQLLLPHELAHQWWGNGVAPSSYQSNWIVEAMANYSALKYIGETAGKEAEEALLAQYRADLTTPMKDGSLIDSFGPVTFDERLLNNFGARPWHDILYEKGTWIFQMLEQRMGEANFREFQKHVLTDFADRPISNEDLRKEAAAFLIDKRTDGQLTSFFDTWVYGTGIPTLTIKAGTLTVSDVPDGFAVDIPLHCGPGKPMWVKEVEGQAKVPLSCSLPAENTFLFRK